MTVVSIHFAGAKCIETPVFEYFLIDITRFDDKLLEKLKGAAASFFLLDKTDLTQREKAERRVVGILKKLIHSDYEIYNLLGRYISELIFYKGLEIPVINDYFSLTSIIIPLKQAMSLLLAYTSLTLMTEVRVCWHKVWINCMSKV